MPRLFASLLFLALLGVACDGAFIAEDKVGLPADHTLNEDGVWHKPEHERPFSARSGCSQSDCHHGDLRGGLALVDGQTTSAPSCYQCHGREWSERDEPLASIKPLRATYTTL